MFEDHNDTVYEIIKGANLLEPAQLDELNESHLHTGKSLADAVIDSEVVSGSRFSPPWRSISATNIWPPRRIK
jgi:hypothetical protein